MLTFYFWMFGLPIIASNSVDFLRNGAPTLILVDGFSHHLSDICKSYCDEMGIRIKDVVSPYLCDLLNSQGRNVPEHLRAPVEGAEVQWAEAESIDPSYELCAISESESGISTAERLQVSLRCQGNGKLPQLRNKFLANNLVKRAGLSAVRQKLVKVWEDGKTFIEDVWSQSDVKSCVLKPCRGVASDGVYHCHTLDECESAFRRILGQPRYGGGKNSAVLIQEYADGPEYAVDTVTKDGETKVLALWRYEKKCVNGAPFVYQCTELIDAEAGEAERAVCDYCERVLAAQQLSWGPTHTEIKLTSSGPKLVEFNARWHGQNFVPITRRCLGTDAVTSTLDTVFRPEAFDALPRRPQLLSSARGAIVHLISTQEGVITAIHHLEELRALPSVQLVEVSVAVGDVLVRTVDIRTDEGYVLLVHEDEAVLAADRRRIVELQSTMFEVQEQVPRLRTASALAAEDAFVSDDATVPPTEELLPPASWVDPRAKSVAEQTNQLRGNFYTPSWPAPIDPSMVVPDQAPWPGHPTATACLARRLISSPLAAVLCRAGTNMGCCYLLAVLFVWFLPGVAFQ